MINETEIYERALCKANQLINAKLVVGVDLFQLADTIIALENEKYEKNALSDSQLDFNDEIVSIESVGELETTDISVSGDNLFYCNGILTKNSFGLPATADLFIALMRTEQLDAANQILVKQLKNRYTDPSQNKRFVIGLDRPKMRLYDVADALSGVMQTADANASAAPSPFAAPRTPRQQFDDFKV